MSFEQRLQYWQSLILVNSTGPIPQPLLYGRLAARCQQRHAQRLRDNSKLTLSTSRSASSPLFVAILCSHPWIASTVL